MTPHIDDKTLVAYVDGELDEATTREVEATVAANPKLAETVRSLREGAALLHAAFAEPVRAAVPDRLIETVGAGFAERTAGRRGGEGPRGWHFHQPVLASMAASVAVLIISLAGAYVFAERQVERRLARLEAARAADQRMIETAVAVALEKHLSGMPAHWSNPESGSEGQVEPVRTFRIANGQWCREYVLESALRYGHERHQTRRAIACREPDGTWKTRLEITEES